MDFLNIGTGELVFLILLGILVVGPRRTVQLMQQAGRFLARVQQEWRNVQRDVMAEVETLKEEALGGVEPGLQEDLRRVQERLTSEAQALKKEALAVAASAEKTGSQDATLPSPPSVQPGDDKAG